MSPDIDVDDEHDDIIYPSAIPFVIVHLACFAAIWSMEVPAPGPQGLSCGSWQVSQACSVMPCGGFWRSPALLRMLVITVT